MPELSGFELLESIRNKPYVIFTTAFDKYALKSYEYDAIDYLVKPISFSRFYKAVQKIVGKNPVVMNAKPNIGGGFHNFIFVNDNGHSVKINTDDIDYIKGWSNYVIVKTIQKKYVVRDNLKSIAELLNAFGFIRVHKSFIIPLSKIEKVDGNGIDIKGENIPIGKLYKEEFLQQISKLRIG